MSGDRTSEHTFFVGSALLFGASAATTIVACSTMSPTGGMDMPGGWTMSMAWMRMPGQTWLGASAAFMCMWVVMMVAMMLPSLLPMLRQYRRDIAPSAGTHLFLPTANVAFGYFLVWVLWGTAAYPVGVALSNTAMASQEFARSVPIAAGIVIVFAGLIQFTAWKAHHLACCRIAPDHAGDRTKAGDARAAWRYGVSLGLHCSCCCFGLMATLLVIGVMDLPAMGVVATAITVERLAYAPAPTARAIGALTLATGIFLIFRALSG